jgi:hypothetical protein
MSTTPEDFLAQGAYPSPPRSPSPPSVFLDLPPTPTTRTPPTTSSSPSSRRCSWSRTSTPSSVLVPVPRPPRAPQHNTQQPYAQILSDLGRSKSKLHIVEYGVQHGLQYPGLLHFMAKREGGPPEVRLTAIDATIPRDNNQRLLIERDMIACEGAVQTGWSVLKLTGNGNGGQVRNGTTGLGWAPCHVNMGRW